MKLRAGSGFTLQHALQVADGFQRGEASLAEVGLIAVFEGAEQFHAIQRTEVQVGFEIGIG